MTRLQCPCTSYQAALVHLSPSLFQLVKSKIKAEFQRCRTDPDCQEAYSTFQYLHEKLAHIKKLVHDYDQARLAGR